MRFSGGKYGVCLAALACAATGLSTEAQAGAFAVREQSAYFQGMSFAGSAAGDSLSSMFWNSAAAAAAPGFNSESHVALVVPHTEITADGTSALVALGLDANSGSLGDPTVVPASYYNYQLNDRLFLGMALNGSFGFTTKPEHLDFAGTPIATTSRIFTLNFNPTVAYKLTPALTVGVGAQILYADLRLRSSNSEAVTALATAGVPGGPIVSAGRTTEADDWGFGGTAGVLWQPNPGTTIGVGYRSQIELEGKGTCEGFGLSNLATAGLTGGNPFGCLTRANVSADLTLPDMVTASFRQQLSERLTLLGTLEWTNWSVVGDRADFRSGGQIVDTFPLGYDDGWFASVGAEYKWTPDTTLRAGVGYEWSPVSDEVRNVSLPDNDRVWLSVGASTKFDREVYRSTSPTPTCS